MSLALVCKVLVRGSTPLMKSSWEGAQWEVASTASGGAALQSPGVRMSNKRLYIHSVVADFSFQGRAPYALFQARSCAGWMGGSSGTFVGPTSLASMGSEAGSWRLPGALSATRLRSYDREAGTSTWGQRRRLRASRPHVLAIGRLPGRLLFASASGMRVGGYLLRMGMQSRPRRKHMRTPLTC